MLVAALLGCGSSGVSGGPADGGGAGDGGQDATLDAAEESTPIDAGDEPAPDAGVVDAADDGSGPNPGKITCDTLTCNVISDACCIPSAADAGGPSCIPQTNPCEGAHYFCDENADCFAGWNCCWYFGTYMSSICVKASTCSVGQRCKTDAECDGGPCLTLTCGDAGTVRSCTNMPGCN
jgi:hypothetical protein